MKKETIVKIGDTYGRLTISSEVFYKTFPSGSKAKFVECTCSCGNNINIRLGSLTNKVRPTRSCGCLQKEAIKNLTEQVPIGSSFGRLTVVENLGIKNKRNIVIVSCSCGSPEFEVRLDALKSNNTKSCGCLQKEVVLENSTRHGMTNTTAYSSWQGMKDRCTNDNNSRWERYGGRGITYDPKWETFEGFWEDMEEGWWSGADIDRIDFNNDYFKENCRWADRSVSNHNKSKSQGTSIYKGVYYDKTKQKWCARLMKNGKLLLFKRFSSELQAAIAYDDASEIYYADRPNKT